MEKCSKTNLFDLNHTPGMPACRAAEIKCQLGIHVGPDVTRLPEVISSHKYLLNVCMIFLVCGLN